MRGGIRKYDRGCELGASAYSILFLDPALGRDRGDIVIGIQTVARQAKATLIWDQDKEAHKNRGQIWMPALGDEQTSRGVRVMSVIPIKHSAHTPLF